jgi:hypothetical protein
MEHCEIIEGKMEVINSKPASEQCTTNPILAVIVDELWPPH